MTFLAIDVGNTRLKWAIYEGFGLGQQPTRHGAVFLEHIDKLAEGEWSELPAPRKMLGCVVAGDLVRRRVEQQIQELWDVSPQWVVSSNAEAGLTNGYEHPSHLGSDRWVAMIGAWHGQRANVFCVDYSVGGRWQARQRHAPLTREFKLAALQWPERTLVFDDGSREATEGFAQPAA